MICVVLEAPSVRDIDNKLRCLHPDNVSFGSKPSAGRSGPRTLVERLRPASTCVGLYVPQTINNHVRCTAAFDPEKK